MCAFTQCLCELGRSLTLGEPEKRHCYHSLASMERSLGDEKRSPYLYLIQGGCLLVTSLLLSCKRHRSASPRSRSGSSSNNNTACWQCGRSGTQPARPPVQQGSTLIPAQWRKRRCFALTPLCPEQFCSAVHTGAALCTCGCW